MTADGIEPRPAAVARPSADHESGGEFDGKSPAAAAILLVEDNPSNQAVALQQLAKLGYVADLASTGREAVERLSRSDHGYQLVLMDCQMPEMDGMQATQAVRALERAQGRHVPIVAMTAQADERRSGALHRCRDGRLLEQAGSPGRPSPGYRSMAGRSPYRVKTPPNLVEHAMSFVWD